MIITLKKNDFTAKIDTLGAQLISLSDGKIEYIWQREKPHWQDCAPILFPVVGRCLGGVIDVEGKSYEMPLHGFVSGMEFELVSESENKVTMLLKSNEKTLERYPYEFELYVEFTLDDKGIKTELKVVNFDNKEIYFGIGGHPGICSPLYEGDSFEDYRLEFDKEYKLMAIGCDSDMNILPEQKCEVKLEGKSLPLKRELFDNDAIVIEDAPFTSVKFLNKENKGIDFVFSNFNSFAVWTHELPAKAPFVCLEPWNSMGKRKGETSVLKDKFDIISLEKGKEFICSYSINPIR